MILEYKYLVGFLFNNGNYIYEINDEGFCFINCYTNYKSVISIENIIHLDMKSESKLTIDTKDNYDTFFSDSKFISKLKKYYTYNKRKSIIKNL